MTIMNTILVVLLFAGLLVTGCAMTSEEQARHFMDEMDQLPPEEQVPNWENTRALMVREAPRVGDLAPDFELKKQYTDETVRLSEYPPVRPVVLIFGSWT